MTTTLFGLTDMAVLEILLIVLVLLLVQVLRWQKHIATALGCHPPRTRRMKELERKLGYGKYAGDRGLTEAKEKELHEELAELADAEFRLEPAKGGQMVRMIELLMEISKQLAAMQDAFDGRS